MDDGTDRLERLAPIPIRTIVDEISRSPTPAAKAAEYGLQ